MDLRRARQVIHRPRRHSKDSEGLAVSPERCELCELTCPLADSAPARMFRFIIDVESYPGGKSQQGPG